MEKKELYMWRKRVGNQFETLKDIIKENPDPLQQLQLVQDLCVSITETFGRSVSEKISLLEIAKLILFNYHQPLAAKRTIDDAERDKEFIDEAEEELK